MLSRLLHAEKTSDAPLIQCQLIKLQRRRCCERNFARWKIDINSRSLVAPGRCHQNSISPMSLHTLEQSRVSEKVKKKRLEKLILWCDDLELELFQAIFRGKRRMSLVDERLCRCRWSYFRRNGHFVRGKVHENVEILEKFSALRSPWNSIYNFSCSYRGEERSSRVRNNQWLRETQSRAPSQLVFMMWWSTCAPCHRPIRRDSIPFHVSKKK